MNTQYTCPCGAVYFNSVALNQHKESCKFSVHSFEPPVSTKPSPYIFPCISNGRVSMKSEVIVRTVCETLELELFHILSKSRQRPICEARFIISFLLKAKNRFGPSQIARILGLDHSSIIYGLIKTKELANVDTDFYRKLYMCCKAVDTTLAGQLSDLLAA